MQWWAGGQARRGEKERTKEKEGLQQPHWYAKWLLVHPCTAPRATQARLNKFPFFLGSCKKFLVLLCCYHHLFIFQQILLYLAILFLSQRFHHHHNLLFLFQILPILPTHQVWFPYDCCVLFQRSHHRSNGTLDWCSWFRAFLLTQCLMYDKVMHLIIHQALG